MSASALKAALASSSALMCILICHKMDRNDQYHSGCENRHGGSTVTKETPYSVRGLLDPGKELSQFRVLEFGLGVVGGEIDLHIVSVGLTVVSEASCERCEIR